MKRIFTIFILLVFAFVLLRPLIGLVSQAALQYLCKNDYKNNSCIKARLYGFIK